MTVRRHSSRETLERINFRLKPEDKQLFEAAAAKNGWTLTQFAKLAMSRYAKKIFSARKLSDADRDLFLFLLNDHREPNAALQNASRNYQRLFERASEK